MKPLRCESNTPSFAAAAREAVISPARPLLALTLAGFAVRLGFLLLEPASSLVGDEKAWIHWAVEALSSPETSFSPLRLQQVLYPPLYLYFIALSRAFFGTLTAVKWTQVVVSALLVPAVGWIGRRTSGHRSGVVAAAFTAFYPELIWYSVHFWSETLFLTLLWWAIERTLAASISGAGRTAACAGMLWGLAALTRETALYFVPIAAVWMAMGRPRDGVVRRSGVLLLGTLLTVAPWTYRNWTVFHAFVPVSTASGLNLWQGNTRMTRAEIYQRYAAIADPIEQYRYARQKGLEAVIERQPAWIVEKLVYELPRFWEADSLALAHIRRGAYGTPARRTSAAAAAFLLAPYVGVLVLCVVGVVRLEIDRGHGLLLLFLGYYVLIHVVTHGFSRYRLPVLPVLFVLAADAWVALGARSQQPFKLRQKALAVALGGGLALCIIPSLRSSPTSSQGDPVVRFGNGWSDQEGLFRWTDGPLATLYVDIQPADAAILDLKLRPFLTLPKVNSQRMGVSLNGEQVAVLVLDTPEATMRTIVLPHRLVRARNELRFALPDARSPWSAGDGDDHRELGVALHWMRLRRFPVLPQEGVPDLGASTAAPFLGTGWSSSEPGFRWTVGHRAELLFAIPADRGQLLQIEFHPFLVPGKRERQRVQVILNERIVANLELVRGADRPWSLTLPRDVLEPENVLSLILPDAVSPASLGRGNDSRLLGIAVHRLTLTTRVGDAF